MENTGNNNSLGELWRKYRRYSIVAAWRIIIFLLLIVSIFLVIFIKLLHMPSEWIAGLIVAVTISSLLLLLKYDYKYADLKKKEKEYEALYHAEVAENLTLAADLYEDLYRKRIRDSNIEDAELVCSLISVLCKHEEHMNAEEKKDFITLYKYARKLEKRIDEYHLGDKDDRHNSKGNAIMTPFTQAIDRTESPSNNSSNAPNGNNGVSALRIVPVETSTERVIESKDSDQKNPIPIDIPVSNEKEGSRITKIDFVKQLAGNIELGLRGELEILEYERKKLVGRGRSDLANRMRHVSQEDGDGLGYDILSYSENGENKFIEVKTTRGSINNQFYLSNNELNFIQANEDLYFLYRLSILDDSQGELDITMGKDVFDKFELHPNQYIVKLKHDICSN